MTENLLTRLLRAQRAAKSVTKQGENKAQGYKYARAEDVIREALGALHDAELVASMNFDEISEREITAKSGGVGIYVNLTARLRIADPESGEVYAVTGYGAGVDYPGDKAIYKAMTGAAKYAYASALGIPFGDDPEDETTSSPTAQAARGHAKVTDAQLDLFERLLKEKGVTVEDALVYRAWAKAKLTGGRQGTMSSAIDGLKNNAAETIEKIKPRADEWADKEAAMPADDTDLPSLEEAEQGTLA